MARSCSARLHGEAAVFTAALRSLVNNPQFSDVTFVVGREQQQVFAHRCVLACRCQAFRGMLTSDKDPLSSVPPQGPFILGNVQPEVFLAVIEFLYTNSVTLTLRHSAGTAGPGASRAGVGTRQLGECSMVGHLPKTPQCLLQPSIPNVPQAVLERPVPEVAALPVQELRLPLLAPSELATLESQNQHDLLIPVDSIAAAWRSHALRHGSGVPSHLCRPRHGTRPRNHHRHLDPYSK
uniref:BTB domain containing 19 n=1 Tax=Pavo cristatus TaxID=9049 RepID=A0A8C9L2I5_PAVCR